MGLNRRLSKDFPRFSRVAKRRVIALHHDLCPVFGPSDSCLCARCARRRYVLSARTAKEALALGKLHPWVRLTSEELGGPSDAPRNSWELLRRAAIFSLY